MAYKTVVVLENSRMVKVTYPVPYRLRVVLRGSRSTVPQMVDVSDVYHGEFREISGDDTIVAATVDTKWPHVTDELTKAFVPTVAIRHFEGKFFVPMWVFPKIGITGLDPRPMVPNDIDELGQMVTNYYSPIEKPYAHQGNDLQGPSLPAVVLSQHRSGKLPALDQLKIKRIASTHNNHQQTQIDAAKADLARYLSIDGMLWRETRGEPVIRYMVSGKRTRLCLGDNCDALIPNDEVGEFRLDRLDDCMEHVKSLRDLRRANDTEFLVDFERLIINDPTVFCFDDEERAVFKAGRMLLNSFANAQERHLSIPEAVQSQMQRLEELTLSKKPEQAQAVVDTLELIRAHWPEGLHRPRDLDGTVERWNLRPMTGPGVSP